jgi:hypothetical protein
MLGWGFLALCPCAIALLQWPNLGQTVDRVRQREQLFDACQPVFPDLVKEHGRLNIAQAIFGDLAESFFAH